MARKRASKRIGSDNGETHPAPATSGMTDAAIDLALDILIPSARNRILAPVRTKKTASRRKAGEALVRQGQRMIRRGRKKMMQADTDEANLMRGH